MLLSVYFEKKAEFGGFSNELKNGKIELESQNQRIVALRAFGLLFFSERLREEEKKQSKSSRVTIADFGSKAVFLFQRGKKPIRPDSRTDFFFLFGK